MKGISIIQYFKIASLIDANKLDKAKKKLKKHIKKNEK